MHLDDWTSIIGTGASSIKWSPYDDLKVKLGDQFDNEKIRARGREIFAELMAQETVMPGVTKLIAEAENAGLKLAVASSSPSVWVEKYLGELGLRQHFQVVKTEDDVAIAKPHPELYLEALKALGVNANEAFALEDSANGTTAAIAAGLFCVTVPNRLTKHTSLEHTSLMVDSLASVTLNELCAKAEQYYLTL
jgi:putative hydrolase of the HAD superfamily